MSAIIISALLGVILMLSGIMTKKSNTIQWLAIASSVILMGASIYDMYNLNNIASFYNQLELNNVNAWFNVLISFCFLVYIFMFHKHISNVGKNDAEYFALLFFIMCGVYLLSMYTNLLILFIGIEIVSIPQYILAGSNKTNVKSNEASLKYFLMGAFSTGILLMAIALLYGSTGSFDILSDVFASQFQSPVALKSLSIIGILLLVVSFGFKASAAPFHYWTPDVYDGSPTSFTPFMASIVKVSVFFAFIRLFHFSFGSIHSSWQLTIGIMIGLTLLIGNITAVYQQSVKRMLAYSSIAQAGFMLFAIFAYNKTSWDGLMLYSVVYTLATLGIFAALKNMNDYTYDGFNGLAKKHPILAFTTTVCLMSLAGIPLTGGFFAKYYVLSATIEQGSWLPLVIFAVIMAAVSAFYYFKIIISMYFKSGNPVLQHTVSQTDKAVLIINALLLILLGLLPSLVIG
ncbi:MAG: NADH-quinone oxidoreductase subunit N [Chitinophagaceae bacterium]